MKRFLLVLLALGLLSVFSASALAADVKFSGQYYAAGMYVDQTSLQKDTTGYPATAFYFQRLRVRTDFVVTPALSLITRFDALERIWGGARSAVGTTADVDSSGTRAENENIAFDWAYINYKAPIGVFQAGIMNKGTTGTAFGNNIAPAARIKYAYTYGPIFVEVQTSKLEDKSRSFISTATYNDADRDEYGIEGVYSWKGGKAGVNVTYNRDARKRPAPDNYEKTYWQVVPYAMAKIGPVALEAELGYVTGKERDYDNATADIKMTGLSGYLNALADFGMFYAGGTFAYVSGDNPNTTNKREGGTLTGGRDWNPCLILFGYYDTYRWVGPIRGHDASATGDVNNAMANAFFYQGRVGVRPIADLDIMASLAYATADRKPTGYLKKDYGMEFDLTATYKITNNLSYMLGGGYLWTGDYFKYNNAANKVSDNYMLINKLTLTF
ncbi:MAG TPA: hypothetical protein P5294_02250 [Smithellaceae bacterium]|nr:hypothetical protein [Smithellaceae bacterium]HRS88579.1 hypothetical protein [Smithellaceae bacterium]HRV25333.1 hypothetical protein [Smithellaceae bacterium]